MANAINQDQYEYLLASISALKLICASTIQASTNKNLILELIKNEAFSMDVAYSNSQKSDGEIYQTKKMIQLFIDSF